MPRLVDHALRQAEGLPLRLDDIEGKEVTITAVRFNSGEHGPYCCMTTVNEDGEVIEVMTSAMLVLDAMENAEKADAFPLDAKFTKPKRTWMIE